MPKPFLGRVVKRAKPTSAVINSLFFQSCKTLSQVCKITKQLLIAGSSKKILLMKKEVADQAQSDSATLAAKLEKEIVHHKDLKAVSHSEIASFIAMKSLSISERYIKTIEPTKEVNREAPMLCKVFENHARIKQAIKQIEEKISIALEKNTQLRSAEQRKEASQAKNARKEQLTKKNIGLVSCILVFKFFSIVTLCG